MDWPKTVVYEAIICSSFNWESMVRKLFNINSRILNQFYIYVYFCWLWKWDIFILKVCIFSRDSQLYKLLVAGRGFPCLFWFPLPKIENMMYLKYCWKPCTERTQQLNTFFLDIFVSYFSGIQGIPWKE